MKEIGSDFNIPLGMLVRKQRSSLRKDYAYYSRGRDCIYSILLSLYYLRENNESEDVTVGRRKIVLLPSYVCDSILTPFHDLAVPYSFYEVRKNLSINFDALAKLIERKNVSAVFVIHYFGFQQKIPMPFRDLCRKNSVIIVEDTTHSFLSSFLPVGDVSFASYPKILPIMDGARISFHKGFSISLPLFKSSFSHTKYLFVKYSAAFMKSSFPFAKVLYYSLFRYAEEILVDAYKKPAGMSWLSTYILQRQDISRIIRKRRENYAYLLSNASKFRYFRPLFQKIPVGVCPLGFPLVMEDSKKRDVLRKVLIQHQIYCPIHWELPEGIDRRRFADSWDLSSRVLTIPIDQRYGLEDMSRIVSVLEGVHF